MIVSCPSCGTRYLVDPTALGEIGRKVRCAKCTHSWHEDPPEDMPKRVDVDVLPPEPEVRPIPAGSNLPAIVQRRRRANRLGWIAIAAAIIIIVVGGLVARHPIMSAWPPSGKLYGAIGFTVDEKVTQGLEFRNVAREQVEENGVPVLVIRGEIWNTAEQDRHVPPIRIGLIDEDNRELHHWTFAADEDELSSGTATEFVTRLASPPAGATSLLVRFAGDSNG